MACVAVAQVPAGPEWEYELKFDGYRAIGFKTHNRVHLASRNGKDFSERFPELVHALEPLPDETVIDGEIVALDGTGHPSFNPVFPPTAASPRLTGRAPIRCLRKSLRMNLCSSARSSERTFRSIPRAP
jgi:bifunctional non-homologous end joining protein LigD